MWQKIILLYFCNYADSTMSTCDDHTFKPVSMHRAVTLENCRGQHNFDEYDYDDSESDEHHNSARCSEMQ